MNATQIKTLLGDALISQSEHGGELTCEVAPSHIIKTCTALRDTAHFETLIDLCGVDYATWGADDDTQGGSGSAGGPEVTVGTWTGNRFAVVYHLLSLKNNSRLRLRASLDENAPTIDSINEVWASANWYEREAFDLFGIIFHGHPDLRRLLTDYGFIGHPLRKDFPLSGQVEMRYDEQHGRVIYQPVTIPPRILVPRTISKPVDATSDTTDD